MKNILVILEDNLKEFGLSTYEARVLIALIKIGKPTNVAKLFEISNVPRTKIYEVLDSLIERKIVSKESFIGRTNIFSLIPTPEEVINTLYRNKTVPLELTKNNASKLVSKLHKSEGGIDDEEREIWIIKGEEHINRIERELIDYAQKEIYSNVFLHFIRPILPNLAKAKKRGVSTTLVMFEEEVTEIEKESSLENISTNYTGINFGQFSNTIKELPFPGEIKDLASLAVLFYKLLKNRPNFLLIDPKTKNENALLIIRSIDPSETMAVHIKNREFIIFIYDLFELIFAFTDKATAVQNLFLNKND